MWTVDYRPRKPGQLLGDASPLSEADLRRLMHRLGHREQFILRRRLERTTLRAVGKEIGITTERVRQIECTALRKMYAMKRKGSQEVEL